MNDYVDDVFEDEHDEVPELCGDPKEILLQLEKPRDERLNKLKTDFNKLYDETLSEIARIALKKRDQLTTSEVEFFHFVKYFAHNINYHYRKYIIAIENEIYGEDNGDYYQG